MHRWLQARGVRAAVASPGLGSTIDHSIPRISLFDEAQIDSAAASDTVDIAHVQAPPSSANFTAAPVFCHNPSSSAPVGATTPLPCVTLSHPQDGFAFTQWEKGGPIEWRLGNAILCLFESFG
jgi:hypothetical protein